MNSQPRREVFGGRMLRFVPLGRLLPRCSAPRWAFSASVVLAGAVLLIGCGRTGDPPAISDAGSSTVDAGSSGSLPNIEAPASNLENPAEGQAAGALSDEASGDEASGEQFPVTPVAFAEAGQESSGGGAKSVTFDDIKFEMKKEEKFKQRMLTEKVTGLFDKDIRIRGYILPTFKQSGLTQFVLVRDNQECCFGPKAALYDCIIVHMTEGHTAEFSTRPVTVEGKFSFQKLEIDGTLLAIYHLDGVSVK